MLRSLGNRGRSPGGTLGAGVLLAFVLCPNLAAAASETLLSALLPASRSVQVGDPATVFATIVNDSSVMASGCSIAPLTGLPADFSYQTTTPANQLIGTPDTPVPIAAGGLQNFVISFLPTGPIDPVDVELSYACDNVGPALIGVGINTLLLVADTNPVPDIIAIAQTFTRDGIVNLSPENAFSVATSNVGSSADIRISADTGAAALPVEITLCQTDTSTGACINPTVPSAAEVSATISAGATPTFSVFIVATANVPDDPANNRVFVRFTDGAGTPRGATSVAVRSSVLSP